MRLGWFVVVILSILVAYFLGWNIGFDTGVVNGFNTALIEGKVLVECKFPLNWKEHCKEVPRD